MASTLGATTMITCHLRYVIDPSKIIEFEEYGRMWLKLIKKFGGVHHGYLLPSEGASNIALASFSFTSLAEYEQYRIKSLGDPECHLAFKFAKETQCFLSYERTFFRPLVE
jgi:hypothetical protein